MIIEETSSIFDTISLCYKEDPTFPLYNRNFGTAEELALLDTDYLKTADSSFKFYKIMDDELLGYFGKETIDNVDYLTTFFIRKHVRNKKDLIWKYIESHFSKPFYTGQYKINTRSLGFCKKMGGTIVGELEQDNKSFYIIKFGE